MATMYTNCVIIKLIIAHPSTCSRHSIEKTADTGRHMVCWNKVVTKDGSEPPPKSKMKFLEKVSTDKSNEVPFCEELHHFSEEGVFLWTIIFLTCHWCNAFLCCFALHIILCMSMVSCIVCQHTTQYCQAYCCKLKGIEVLKTTWSIFQEQYALDSNERSDLRISS